MLHALFRNNNLLGLYSDYNLCQLMIEGLVSNKLVDRKSLTIKSYHENSMVLGNYKEKIIEEYNSSVDTTESIHESIHTEDLDTETYKQIKEERAKKCELQYKLELLKKEREKIDESKRVFEVDMKLFNTFKKAKETNIDFEIPELFLDKWELMLVLEEEGVLNWENFYRRYTRPKYIETGYSKIFGESVVPNKTISSSNSTTESDN